MRIRVGMLMAAVLVLAACQGERATVTGQYGAAVMTGQVVMADGSSPAGVSVTLRGTSISTLLRADGQFAFAGAPEEGDLSFERAADGISALLRVEPGSGPMVVELSKNSAKKSSSKRRSGRGGSGSGVAVTQFEGVISSVSPTGIVLFTSKQVDQAIAFDAATIIRKGKTTLTPADLLAAMRVHVKAKQVDGAYVATLVMVQNDGSDDDDGGEDDQPEGREYEGIVLTAAEGQLVIRDSHRDEVTFVLDAATDIRKGNTPVAASAIQPGWRVHVKATTSADGATRTATRVIVQNTNGGAEDEVKVSGRIVSIAGSALTVETGRGAVTVQTDAATTIERRGSAILLTDLAAGDKVKAEGTRVDATTILAREIEAK
ncbi:MAG TPA: DUF5666 domain-containing protein [Thermoanaerobaculia bacterium]|nr:DUF5666 domain-containing protein [Thermoanaerobaculia bacterium]